MKSRFLPYLATVLATLGVLAAIWTIGRSEQARFRQQNRTSVLHQVSAIRAKLEGALNSRLLLGRGLVAYVATHPEVDDAAFQEFAKQLVGQQTGVHSLTLARNSVVSNIYPRAGNEAGLGLDLLRDVEPARRRVVQRAIDTRDFVIAGPVELRVGGVGIIGRIPIFLPSPAEVLGHERYWGLASVLIDLHLLLEEAGILDKATELRYVLRGKDGLGASGEVFFGDAVVFQADPVTLEVSLPAGSWQLAAVPADGWPALAPGSWKGRGGGGLLALTAGVLTWFLAREPARLHEAVERATGALRESEERYRSVIAAMEEGIILHDADGSIRACNASAERILGVTAERMRGRTSLEPEWRLIHEDGSPFPNDTHPAALTLQTGKPCLNVIMGVNKPGGTLTWVSINTQPLFRSGEATPRAVVASLADITEQKRTQEALAAEARFLRAQTEVARVALSSLQPEILIPRLLETIGHAQGYASGFFWRVTDEGDAAVCVASFGEGTAQFVGFRQALSDPHSIAVRAIRTGQASFANRVQEDPLGALLIPQALRAQAILGLPLVHRSGSVVGALTFDDTQNPDRFSERDLTQGAVLASQVAQALENSELFSRVQQLEDQYRVMTESLDDAVYTIDTEGRIRFGNSALERMTGYQVAELLGHPATKLYPASMVPLLTERRRRALGGEPVRSHVETEMIRRDGTSLPIELSASSLILDGRIAGRVVVARDITERKHLEAQLFQAQKMEAVGRLAGGVAHDFNNLLTVISGHSQLLLYRLGPGDSSRRHAEEIKNAADRAASVTHQLLAFSRKQVLQPKAVDLNAVVNDMAAMLRPLIGEDIELVIDFGTPLGHVKADPAQLEQVIMNLVVNACDAMPDGGKLTIETAKVEREAAYTRQHAVVRSGPYVMLAVRDTGYGMDAAVQSHLFEPFFTTKEKGKGTGLGLSTVYGIVTQSGGHIEVDSALGRGSTFRIYLPRVEEPIEPALTASPVAKPPEGSETILLVEDETEVRDLAHEILEMAGYIVLEAANGDEALRIRAQHEGVINLLLTDVVMPGKSGPEVAQYLAPFYPEMKVLYMSGYTGDAIADRGFLDSETPFLQKPFTLDALAHKVRQVLDAPM